MPSPPFSILGYRRSLSSSLSNRNCHCHHSVIIIIHQLNQPSSVRLGIKVLLAGLGMLTSSVMTCCWWLSSSTATPTSTSLPSQSSSWPFIMLKIFHRCRFTLVCTGALLLLTSDIWPSTTMTGDHEVDECDEGRWAYASEDCVLYLLLYSMGGNNSECLEELNDYLHEEYQAKKGILFMFWLILRKTLAFGNLNFLDYKS